MKKVFFLLAVSGLLMILAAPLSSQTAVGHQFIRFEISGTSIALGNPFTSPVFPVLPTFKGKSNLGGITGQGLYMYLQLQPTPQGIPMVCVGGQAGIRFDSTGDMLLLQATPGQTGLAVSEITWEQTFTGVVVAGTGRFAGATGTFTMILNGRGPGSVNIFEGTLEIQLDAE